MGVNLASVLFGAAVHREHVIGQTVRRSMPARDLVLRAQCVRDWPVVHAKSRHLDVAIDLGSWLRGFQEATWGTGTRTLRRA